MGQWFQRLRANAKYGAVNDATIQGYLRAASQLEDVWQQLDEKVDALLLEGQPPWEAYANLGYALAFVRACRMNVVFAQELLKAEISNDNANAGFLPRITYDQALALCEHIEPLIEEGLKAATNPRYTLPFSAFPLKLGPHVGGTYQSFPLSHLQGTIGAAQEMRDWTAGLLAKYELALQAAKETIPAAVKAHLERMKNELSMGDFHLRTGVDMVGQISQGQATETLQRKAEGLLWEAMDGFYTVSQLIAMPGARFRPVPTPRANAEPSQARPAQTPTPRQSEMAAPQQPEVRASKQSEPDTLSLFNQVIAEPKPAQQNTPQPTAEVIDLLNQLGAGSKAEPPAKAQGALDIAGLLDQHPGAPEKARSAHSITRPGEQSTRSQEKTPLAPDVAGLFGQKRSEPLASDDAPPDMAGLLGQGPAQDRSGGQATKPGKAREQKTREEAARKVAPEDTTLGLLSDICGDGEESTR